MLNAGLLCAALLAGAAADSAQRPKLVVVPLAVTRLPDAISPVLTDFVVASVGDADRYSVIGPADLDAVLGKERLGDLVGCDQMVCLTELTGALDAPFVIGGRASRLGKSIVVSLTLMDVGAMTVVARGTARRTDEEGLYGEVAREAVARLLRLASREQSEALARAAEAFQRAQSAHDAGKSTAARRGFARSAELYAKALRLLADGPDKESALFDRAEALQGAGEFESAAAAYEQAARPGSVYYDDARLGSITSCEELARREQHRVGHDLPPVRRPTPGSAIVPPNPTTVPKVLERCLVAAKRYLDDAPDGQHAALVTYKLGETYYRYDRFPEARAYLEALLRRFPRDRLTTEGFSLAADSFIIEGSYGQLEQFVREAAASEVGTGNFSFAAAMDRVKMAAMFRQAEAFEAKGDSVLAAELYRKIAAEHPRGAFLDAVLNNLAVSCERLKDFACAAETYRQLAEGFPASPLVENAFFRWALQEENASHPEAAIEAYRRLLAIAKKPTLRADGTWNLALLHEQRGEYRAAQEAYDAYCREFRAKADAEEACSRARAMKRKAEETP